MTIRNKTVDENFWDDQRREYEQLSAAEVPGFAARTVIDDTIGKLYALRARLVIDVPAEVPGLLDDMEALAERLIELAYDPDAEPIEKASKVPNRDHLRRWGGPCLNPSGSKALGWCSCGGLYLSNEAASRERQQDG